MAPRWDGLTTEERFLAKVDKTETCWNWVGGRSANGYGQFQVERRQWGAHRWSYQMNVGPIPEGMVIDHICHNKACVNPKHLRAVTQKQNNENVVGVPRHNTSGVRGVVWHKNKRTWQAAVIHHNQRHHVGSFSTLADAEAAVVAKRLELFTHNDADRSAA